MFTLQAHIPKRSYKSKSSSAIAVVLQNRFTKPESGQRKRKLYAGNISSNRTNRAKTSVDLTQPVPKEFTCAVVVLLKLPKVAYENLITPQKIYLREIDQDILKCKSKSKRIELEGRWISLKERKMALERSNARYSIELLDKKREADRNMAMRQVCLIDKEKQLAIEKEELQIRLAKLKDLQQK